MEFKEKNYKILESIQFGISNTYRRRSGIYRIFSITNGKYYIGSAEEFHARWQVHSCHLRQGTHPNTHLLSHKRKYGIQDLEIEVLEFVDNLKDGNLIKREQWWLDNTKCLDREHGFNKSPTAQSVSGMEMPDCHREKVGERSVGNKYRKGFKVSDETKLNISKCQSQKRIAQYTKDGKFIKEFGSFFELKKYGFRPESVRRVLQGEMKVASNFYWRQLKTDEVLRDLLECEMFQKTFTKQKRTICLLGDNGEIMKEWSSARDAAKELKLPMKRTLDCCKGKTETVGGYKLRYKIEHV